MKIINHILYIEFRDFLAAGWKEDTIKKANLRNGANWQMIANPSDGRMPMVQFDTLVQTHKDKLNLHFSPSVHEYMGKAPIKALVSKDTAAETFFTAHRFASGAGLTTEHIARYTQAASWLNMLNRLNADKKFIKKQLGLSLESFFSHVTEIISTDKIGLPASYRKLRERMKQYAEAGYGCLINGRFENQSAAKVEDELTLAQILKLIQNPLQYDDVMVAMLYNTWATAAGYEAISPATVGNYRRKYDAQITMGRYGNERFNERFIRQVKGAKPTKPLALVESDDYNLNYYFNDPAWLSVTKDMARYVSYIVADSAFGLILGKSYRCAKAPTLDMVRLAYIDAMYYIRSLTGGWHLPFELKADGWAKATLHPWYNQIAHFIPAGHGNKHRGYVEQMFGSPHFKRAEKLAAEGTYNYNGNNVTAGSTGVNMDVLKLNAKRRPMVGMEADMQVEKFFYLTRRMPAFTRNDMEAPSREEQWLEAWNQLSAEEKRPISDEQFMLLFGFEHAPDGRNHTITNRGVEFQLNGEKYSYDLPDYTQYIHLIGKQAVVLFDPYDMGRIMITVDGNIRLMLLSSSTSARALTDAGKGSREMLNKILESKTEQVISVTDRAAWRELMIADADQQIDPEAIMLGGYMPKELKADAQTSYDEYADSAMVARTIDSSRLQAAQAREDAQAEKREQQNWHQQQMNYLNQKLNIEDYE